MQKRQIAAVNVCLGNICDGCATDIICSQIASSFSASDFWGPMQLGSYDLNGSNQGRLRCITRAFEPGHSRAGLHHRGR